MTQKKQQQKDMIPTEEWISAVYDFFNEKYFNGELRFPLFYAEKNCVWQGQEAFGYFKPYIEFNNITGRVTCIKSPIGKLVLSTKYARPVKAVQETLLHEMIHVYVNTVLKIVPRNPHGKAFMEKAKEINADGWNITEQSERLDTDRLVGDDEQGVTDFVGAEDAVCIYYQYNNKWYFIKVGANDTNFSERNLKAHGAKFVNIIKLNHGGLDFFPTSTAQNIIGLEANVVKNNADDLAPIKQCLRNFLGSTETEIEAGYKIRKARPTRQPQN